MVVGMEFLHTFDPTIVHRDFKSMNLLVIIDSACITHLISSADGRLRLQSL